MTPSTTALTALSRAAASTTTSCARSILQTRSVAGKRTFTSLPTLRPRLSPHSSVFRPATSSSSSSSTPLAALAPPAAGEATALDLVPRGAVTAHPAALAQQVRFGPRATMARSSRLVRKRRHGFLSRVRTRTGRRTLQHRRGKGRHTLSN